MAHAVRHIHISVIHSFIYVICIFIKSVCREKDGLGSASPPETLWAQLHVSQASSTGMPDTRKYAHTLHYITVHYIALHYITLHHIMLHYITLHYITQHYTTLHYITLHYITLHYTTLHYISLHIYGAMRTCMDACMCMCMQSVHIDLDVDIAIHIDIHNY